MRFSKFYAVAENLIGSGTGFLPMLLIPMVMKGCGKFAIMGRIALFILYTGYFSLVTRITSSIKMIPPRQ
jgi:hypothetical protein